MNQSNKVIAILIVIAVLAIGSSVYFYREYAKTQKLLKNPTEATKEETRELVAKVEKLIELPTGEEPTVATVTDKKKVKDQQFFTKAENEDKVLIYTKAKKAILYRPKINKIIEVAPVYIGDQTPLSKPASTKIVIYNGSAIVGLGSSAEKQLKDRITNIDVVLKENAKKNYDKTLVIDLGAGKDKANEIAKVVKGEVSTLPDGEVKPQADILVILGKNFTQ